MNLRVSIMSVADTEASAVPAGEDSGPRRYPGVDELISKIRVPDLVIRSWPVPPVFGKPVQVVQDLTRAFTRYREIGMRLGFQTFPPPLKFACWELGALDRLVRRGLSVDLLRMCKPLLCNAADEWDGRYWPSFIAGYEVKARALMKHWLEHMEGVDVSAFHVLVAMVAWSEDPETIKLFHRSNSRPIEDTALLGALLEHRYCVGFWQAATLPQLEILLRPEVYRRLGGGEPAWQEYLYRIFNATIRPDDFALCIERFMGLEGVIDLRL